MPVAKATGSPRDYRVRIGANVQMKNLERVGIGLGGIVLAAGLLGFPLRTRLLAAARAASANPRGQTHSASASKSEAPSTDKILQFVRDKFGVVSTVKLSMSPLEPSPHPDYYQTVVNIDD